MSRKPKTKTKCPKCKCGQKPSKNLKVVEDPNILDPELTVDLTEQLEASKAYKEKTKNANFGEYGSFKIRKFKYKGKFVYSYIGCTYGCLGRDETAVTKKPNVLPFLGVPTKELKEVGFVEIE